MAAVWGRVYTACLWRLPIVPGTTWWQLLVRDGSGEMEGTWVAQVSWRLGPMPVIGGRVMGQPHCLGAIVLLHGRSCPLYSHGHSISHLLYSHGHGSSCPLYSCGCPVCGSGRIGQKGLPCIYARLCLVHRQVCGVIKEWVAVLPSSPSAMGQPRTWIVHLRPGSTICAARCRGRSSQRGISWGLRQE